VKVKAGGYTILPVGTLFEAPVGVCPAMQPHGLMIATENESSPDGETRLAVVIFSDAASLFVPLDLEAARRVHQVLGETIERVALGTSWNGPAQ
jgi:hypothetical protein